MQAPTVDEFGREIPAPRREQAPPPPPPRPLRGHPSARYSDAALLCQVVYEQEAGTEESYEDYNRNYCLNYIRSFFNKHLDDSWFRALYSPAVRQQQWELQTARVHKEASLFDGESQPAFMGWRIRTIPPHVTDEQILQRLQDILLLNPELDANGLCLESSGPRLPSLERSAIVYTYDATLLEHLQRILKATTEDRPGSLAVPRKHEDDGDNGGPEPLEIDCTDPYGRLEIDADGRGGAPPDGAATVPVRKATLWLDALKPPHRRSLSLAVSSLTDPTTALALAAAWDAKRQVPTPHKADETKTPQEQMDTAVAYLRRVHNVSYFDGGKVYALADLPSLPVRRNETADATNDVLVERLEADLQVALERAQEPRTDADQTAAAEIAQAQQEAIEPWLEAHSINDDGRGRCSFHFCHKLFKDGTFLRKHLLKKHGEFLVAEQAKAHDSYMMAAWEAATERPVPVVQVDCGRILGLQDAPIEGDLVVDPEPELWKLEEERRKRPRPAAPTPKSGGGGGGFVDVDDMKVEKVELSFDNVPVFVTKKKKKKRKLL